MELYLRNNIEISKLTTLNYSTSFSMGVSLFSSKYRNPIYAIYGFVRYADEIVDTFFGFPQREIFDEFKKDTWLSIKRGVSTNPILHSFQWVVNTYKIDHELIESFLYSMEMDLEKKSYTDEEIKKYIYGSAEVVGLMCLRIFSEQDDKTYTDLISPARKLGEAFQKINFLRDLQSDFKDRGRIYFPGIDFASMSEDQKKSILENIEADFKAAYVGIMQLNRHARAGVYLAYIYYLRLLKKIQKTPVKMLCVSRMRIGDATKLLLIGIVIFRSKLRLL